MDEMQATGTPLELFTHAVNNVEDEQVDKSALQLQRLLANIRYQRADVSLSLTDSRSGQTFNASAHFDAQVTERALDVTFRNFGRAHLTTPGTLRFQFSSTSAPDLGEADYSVYLSRLNKQVSTFRVNLFDDVHDHYEAFQLPTVYATLTVRFDESRQQFELLEVGVTLDLIPEAGTSIAHIPRIDVMPSLHLTSLDNVRSSSTRRYQQGLHEQLRSHLQENFANEGTSRWQLTTNVGTAGDTSTDTNRVVWGRVTDSALAYVIVDDLMKKRALHALDAGGYLSSVLVKTENGQALVELVVRLYAALHEESPLIERTSFPTLRQVLLHTTGLPSTTSVDSKTITDYYDLIIGKLQHAAHEFGTDDAQQQDIDTQLAEIIEHLQSFEEAVSDPNVIVGNHHNIFESLILFMYLQTIAQEHPLSFLWRKLSERFALEVQSVIPGQEDDVDNPFALSLGVTSTYDGLVKFARQIHAEFGDASSVTSHLVLDPVYGHRDAQLAHTLGWSLLRTQKNVDIYFQTSNGTVTSSHALVFFVPELNFWGVFNEQALSFESSASALFFNVHQLIETASAIVDDAVGLEAAERGVLLQAIEQLPNASYARRREEAPLDEERLAALNGREYTNPFIDLVTGKQDGLTINATTDTDGVQRLLLVGSGGRQVELSYTGADDTFFKTGNVYDNGNDVIVTPDYVNLRGQFFLNAEKVRALLTHYRSALSSAQKTISTDIHSQAHITALRSVKRHDVTAKKYYEDGVGARWGGGGFRGGRGWRRPRFGGWGWRRPYGGVGPFALGALTASALYPPYYGGYYNPYYGW